MYHCAVRTPRSGDRFEKVRGGIFRGLGTLRSHAFLVLRGEGEGCDGGTQGSQDPVEFFHINLVATESQMNERIWGFHLAAGEFIYSRFDGLGKFTHINRGLRGTSESFFTDGGLGTRKEGRQVESAWFRLFWSCLDGFGLIEVRRWITCGTAREKSLMLRSGLTSVV